MNLALDATYSLGSELSGVGVYSQEILRGLALAAPGQDFAWYYRPHRFFRARSEPAPPNAHRRLLLEYWGGRSSLFHGLNQRLPQRRFRCQIATFHDLFVLTASYSTPEFRVRFAEQARRAAAEADRIIAVSHFTAKQVQDLLGVEPARIRVVPHGVRALPSVERRPEKVVLSVGAIQERKNTRRLLEAFRAMPPDWRLVLVGGGGFGSAAIREQAAADARVLLTGYLDSKQLAGWYARASIFAFPSLDEGFGMPILEAMAAGVPVITSNRSALPEAAENAAVLVDPERTEEIAEAMSHLAHDADKRRKLSQLGAARASGFTWARAVEQTWKVYGEVTSLPLLQSLELLRNADPEK